MMAPDTSVLVAGFVTNHPFHAEAESVLPEVRKNGRLIAHTTAETFSVLSSSQGVYRIKPRAVVDYLDEFVDRGVAPVQPRSGSYREALDLLLGAGRAGGAIYDALIALTARDAGATLVSLDRRAEPTYALCGVETRMLADA
jgi:predicted nucleic acid-binding protein